VSLLLGVCLLSACSTSSGLYHWGSYEDQIYQSYRQPGQQVFAEQIQTLLQDAEKARANNKPVPPGLHAQLAYLHYQNGDASAAIASFEQEKNLYPESKVYMERLIGQIKH
jgi:hypothetical protein